ncbi:MAG: fluoride efflux transporter CrcB [Clostridiales bacterium]|jgi:CrcB protein|nr:fluoride efflux transporter CrcB [Clostridiales bacterium]
MIQYLLVGIGAFIGANLRYLLTKLIPGSAFPFATLAANIIAGLAIGAVIGLDGSANALPPKWKLFMNTGLLGGLSTFSTFSLETVKLFQSRHPALAGVNILLNLVLALIGVTAGMSATRLIFHRS